MEQIIQGVLLALHNIALVGCAAAPFYNRNLVKSRGQYGPKLSYKLDKVVEDTLQGNAPYCIFFIITLFVTGIGMPLNYYLFHETFREMHIVSTVALVVKLVFVFGMVIIMSMIFYKINPVLSKMFANFSDENKPDPVAEAGFFKLRARRKYLCEICLVFAIMVLISSAFLGFSIQ
ncbi:MAG: hypothetical protein H8E34_04945 [Bacteroidetes bacterium]|nr:hypothetical protein [Bacteroidota bacterium]MBL6944444.1 hypothetical protein [Bacteroidales bacterium]